ncbi:MAG: hypothetical protein NZ809_01740 [Thermodesulfovibrio sp.]|nr:hypothetical protein [Thermodesulfovibrio sp.]
MPVKVENKIHSTFNPIEKFVLLAGALSIPAAFLAGFLSKSKSKQENYEKQNKKTWVVLSPQLESINTLIHTLSGILFMFVFIVHIFFVLAFKSIWPLLKSMFTGWVDEDYIKKRHPIWYEKNKEN